MERLIFPNNPDAWHPFPNEEDADATRATALPDPAASYRKAVTTLTARDARLSKQAIATEMGIDRGTLDRYIAKYALKWPPR